MKFLQGFKPKASLLELESKDCRWSITEKAEQPSRNYSSPERNKGKPPHLIFQVKKNRSFSFLFHVANLAELLKLT